MDDFNKVDEQERTYYYNDWEVLKVRNVVGVKVSEQSGAHYLKTLTGEQHYIKDSAWDRFTFVGEWSFTGKGG